MTMVIPGIVREESRTGAWSTGICVGAGGTGTEKCVTGDTRLLANLKADQLSDP